MPQVQFSKVELKSITRNKKGGGKAKFRAALTKPIQKLMEWEDVAGNAVMEKPGGILAAQKMTLRNATGELAQFEMVVDIQSVSAFEIHRHESEGTRGKSTTLVLDFTAKFVDIQGCGVLEGYMVVAADSKGTLTVDYSPAAKQVDMSSVPDSSNQASLPGTDVDDDDEDEDDE